jgi:hypothetical protein
MTEIWKPMIFADQETGYEISSYGSIRNSNYELQDENFKKFEGHYTFDFKFGNKKQRIKIHRLVAYTFIDNPHYLKYIKHIDDNPFNNNINNLKWVSSKYAKSIDMNTVNKELLNPKFKPNEPRKQIDDVNIQINESTTKSDEVVPLEEIWKPIYINNEITSYDVSIYGEIRVSTTLRARSLSIRTGYKTCTLIHKNKKYAKQVHRLVAEAFIFNDDVNKKHVNHKNYNKLDNRVENLEWITVSENIKHAHQNDERKTTRVVIVRTNLDGTNPVLYESVTKAREEFGSCVIDCLAGHIKQARGYLWAYETPKIKIDEQDLDLTTFKQIENHTNFLISIDGKVYNKTRKSFLTPRQTGSYMSVVLDKKHHCIHRLLALHFIDKPENYNDKWIVNHKDGNKLNNSIENLEWMSASDNTQHAYETGARKTARPIIQKDLDGNIVQEYLNATHASRVLNLGHNLNSQILRACKNPSKSVAFGFKWELKNE